MVDFLWLLLPVAAASGWYGAKQSLRKRPTIPLPIPHEYFAGLNYILNEQPDRAIEVFSRLLQSDNPESIEIHIALGSLFRRRGEVDRAIRIHQTLVMDSRLSKEQRCLALLELGHDYYRAGLLDRAEGLLKDLIELESNNEAALMLLGAVYQQEKEWEKAIAITEQLSYGNSHTKRTTLAQYYCELAAEAFTQRHCDEALERLQQALTCDPACVRASILQGDIHRYTHNFPAALISYQRVIEQDAEYLAEVIDGLIYSLEHLQRPEQILDYLQTILRDHPCDKGAIVYSAMLSKQHSVRDAAVFIANALNKTPSLTMLHRLAELGSVGASGEFKDTFRVIRATLEQLLKQTPTYRCNHCGYGSKALYWLCPSCKTWASIKPRHDGGAEK